MSQPEHPAAELRRLIARLSDGAITPEEVRQLTALLRADPAAQEAYLDHLALDGMLELEFGGEIPLPLGTAAVRQAEFTTRASKPGLLATFWASLHFRPLSFAMLAVGLITGFFSATIVWAYAVPRLGDFAARALPLANGDFESTAAPLSLGIPTTPEHWSGDLARLTGAEQGITPHAGRTMLRFLRADGHETSEPTTLRAAEQWQVIDLRPLRPQFGTRPISVQLAGWFNAVPSPGRRYTCGVSLSAFHGLPEETPTFWQHRHDLSLAEAEREQALDEDPLTWQKVAAQVVIPPDAEILLVQVRVSDKTQQSLAGFSEFAGQYVDDLDLRIISDSAPALAQVPGFVPAFFTQAGLFVDQFFRASPPLHPVGRSQPAWAKP